MMKIIIVDDETNARLALKGAIEENFEGIQIVASCKNVPEAVKAIHHFDPDLVFLDIAMPGYSGIELFKFLDESQLKFKVVFVTAYSEYALDAFELSAVDYLLKPIRIEALGRALKKAKENITPKIQIVHDIIDQGKINKIALQTGDGLTFLSLIDILYLKADGSYTHFVTIDQRKIIVSKKIVAFEKLEILGSFMRIHRSHMINLDRIYKILKQDGGTVVMENGDLLSISQEKKQMLMHRFESKKL